MAATKSNSTVFVGNIPYGTTEDQLRDVFSQAGRVVKFRILYDKETGKPKGFGFCEYEDIETAMSAIRNLNNVEVNGRQLRVDFTETEKREMAAAGGGGVGAGAGGAQSAQQQQPQGSQSQQRGAGMNMKELTLKQIFDLMLQLKAMLQQNPEQLRNLLLSNPPLAHAIVMGLVRLGIMPANVAAAAASNPTMPGSVAVQGGATIQQPPGIPMQPMAPAGQPHLGMQPQAPPAMGMVPPGAPGMVRMGGGGGGSGGAAPPAPRTAEQTALLQQVMNLTPQQIDSLPSNQREQVLQMQATMKAQIAAQQQQFRRF